MNRLVVYIFFILQCLTISVNSYKCGDEYQLSVSYNENICGLDDDGLGEYRDDFGKFVNRMKLNSTMKKIIVGTNDKIKMVDKYSSCRAHRWNGCVIFEFNDKTLITKYDSDEGRRCIILV